MGTDLTQHKPALSLFWRTFAMLLVLLVLGVTAWVLVLRSLEQPGHDQRQEARQLADSLQVSAEALRLSERGQRGALARALSARSGFKLLPRMAGDASVALRVGEASQALIDELRHRLGADLPLASSVNGQAGLWLGFVVERENWWLGAPAPPPAAPALWQLLALAAASLLSLGLLVLVARLVNRPLRELSFAASRVHGGIFDSRLDETDVTSEIREVNRGFNRMARELAKVEEGRAVMLAGISHDLRTPLARLRLEAEMSVVDEDARNHIAQDINQLDAIIDKFMDYARPGNSHLQPVLLSRLIDKEASTFRDPSEIRITSRVAIELAVMADEVELSRVFANLFENARRYGRSNETGIAKVAVSTRRIGHWVICTVADQGPGVAAEKLSQLTTPFFRGDAARTAATGAGLGLAIVEKAMQRMGGQVEIANASEGGLLVHLRLRHALHGPGDAVPAARH